MADNDRATPDTPPAGGEGSQADTAQQQGQGQQPPAGDGTGADSTKDTISLDEARKLRAEAASLRKRLKEFEDKAKADDEAKLSELEREKKHRTEAEQERERLKDELRRLSIERAVESAATRIGIIDPDAAVKLLDHSALKFDSKGAVENAETLLKELVKARPYLQGGTRRPSADGGAGNHDAPPSDMNAAIRRAAGRF